MKAKPNHWRAWTHYCPLPIVLIIVVLMLPVFVFLQILINITDGLENWWNNVIEVVEVMKRDVNEDE